jgi:hypothetical protein
LPASILTRYTSPMLYLLLYLLTGVFAGLAAGLLGVGGGIINVPALAWCFGAQGIDSDIGFRLALGTSLATIIFTGASAPVIWRRRRSSRPSAYC